MDLQSDIYGQIIEKGRGVNKIVTCGFGWAGVENTSSGIVAEAGGLRVSSAESTDPSWPSAVTCDLSTLCWDDMLCWSTGASPPSDLSGSVKR